MDNKPIGSVTGRLQSYRWPVLAVALLIIQAGLLPVFKHVGDLPYTASAYWFIWAAILGRKLAPQLAQTAQVDTINPKDASTLAMMAVVAIPAIGLWELFRPEQPYATRVIRLLIVFLALFLAVTAFIAEYFTKLELFSDIGIAHERLRMAMASGKSVVWDLDVKTGRLSLISVLHRTAGSTSCSRP